MFSEIQEVFYLFYFPIRRTKAINTVLLVGATIPFDRGEVPDWSVCAFTRCIHACPFCTLACTLKNLPLPTLAFIQAWRLQSGEMISQLLTDLLPCLEAALGGP